MVASDVAVELTPAGRRLVVSREIEAPAETVWTLLTDTRWWPVWGPSVGAVEVDGDDRTIREGSTGRVRVAGTWVPFRIDRCRDHRWTWRVAGVPATGHRVAPLDGRSRAAFEVPLLAAPYAAVCARALGTIARLAERGVTEPSSE
jgi:hypothetical protein